MKIYSVVRWRLVFCSPFIGEQMRHFRDLTFRSHIVEVGSVNFLVFLRCEFKPDLRIDMRIVDLELTGKLPNIFLRGIAVAIADRAFVAVNEHEEDSEL